MNQRNIYKELQLEYLWGDAFEIEIVDQDISTEDNRIALLDKVCTLKGLKQLGPGWNKIDFEKASDLLLKSLRYDLHILLLKSRPWRKQPSFKKR